MLRRRSFNPKRRICSLDEFHNRRHAPPLTSIRYRGNPEHKRNPGDFGLTPSIALRPGKTLCDRVGVFSSSEAFELLQRGFQRGMFSVQERNGWPQNVWAVTDQGEPLEAQLEGDGIYHGYPMPLADPFRDKVLERWARS